MRASTLAFLPVLLVAAVAAAPACTGQDPVVDQLGTDAGGDATTQAAGAVSCGAGTLCANGAACVDGFCCNTSCSGTCEACNVGGKEGTCSPVTGKPVHGSCTGDTAGACAGACDGTTRDACTYPEVACGSAASCAGGTAMLAQTCKAGICPPVTPQKCALGCLEDGCLGVVQVAGGYNHACAVLTDGRVRCWGENSIGETGQQGAASGQYTTRPAEVGGITTAVGIAALYYSTCALLADGTVKCWGTNQSGELGNGSTNTTVNYQPSLVTGLTGVKFLAGGSGGHYCAIDGAGQIKCWGGNLQGQLGNGTPSPTEATPVTVCAPDAADCQHSAGATFVALGDNHSCAAFAGGQVACWGGNSQGQLGFVADSVPHPKPISVTGLTATHLTAGNQITCAASEGQAKCFGSNGTGRLGNGQDEDSPTPVAVCTDKEGAAPLTGVTAVTTYDESSCAITNGAVRCWGSNAGGQLGDGNGASSQNYAATQSIAGGAVGIASAGGAHFAVIVDGANRDFRCWGGAGAYQCGDGQGSGTGYPTPVAPDWTGQ